MHVHDTLDEVRGASQRVGDAASSQATLNIALTAVAVTALLVAVLLVQETYRGGPDCGC